MPYLFTPPVAYDNPPIYMVWPDRYRPVPKVGQLLRRYYGGQPRGRSVLRIGGVYRTVDVPSQTDIDVATEVYMGGHVYVVSDSVAAALRDAGYGIISTPLLTQSGLRLLTEDGRSLLAEGVAAP